MTKVRIVNPAFATFSSHMGVTKFENGVSVDHVSAAEMRMLGSITQIVAISDEDGSEYPVGAGVEQVAMRKAQPPVEEKLVAVGAEDTSPENIPADQPVDGVTPEVIPDPLADLSKSLDAEAAAIAAAEAAAANATPPVERKIYTSQELADLADNEGIRGLREIAEPYGVKSNSIDGLIAEILGAQTNDPQSVLKA